MSSDKSSSRKQRRRAEQPTPAFDPVRQRRIEVSVPIEVVANVWDFPDAAILGEIARRRLVLGSEAATAAAVAYLERIDEITSEEFSLGRDRDEREALRRVLVRIGAIDDAVGPRLPMSRGLDGQGESQVMLDALASIRVLPPDASIETARDLATVAWSAVFGLGPAAPNRAPPDKLAEICP